MNAGLERYLDHLFDRLAGTGAAGRRTLAETEAHLADHIDDLIAQGRTPEAATQEAIARYGDPEIVASAMLRTPGRFPLTFHEIVGSLWIFTSTILITSGVSGAICWLVGCVYGLEVMAPMDAMNPGTEQACSVLMARYPQAMDCMNAAMMQNYDTMLFSAFVAGLIGCALLSFYFAARSSRRFARYTALPPKGFVFGAGIIAFGFASVLWFVDGMDDYQRSISWDWSHDFARGAASLLTAVFFAVAAYRHMNAAHQLRKPLSRHAA